jgi:hypothetical protein
MGHEPERATIVKHFNMAVSEICEERQSTTI